MVAEWLDSCYLPTLTKSPLHKSKITSLMLLPVLCETIYAVTQIVYKPYVLNISIVKLRKYFLFT